MRCKITGFTDFTAQQSVAAQPSPEELNEHDIEAAQICKKTPDLPMELNVDYQNIMHGDLDIFKDERRRDVFFSGLRKIAKDPDWKEYCKEPEDHAKFLCSRIPFEPYTAPVILENNKH